MKTAQVIKKNVENELKIRLLKDKTLKIAVLTYMKVCGVTRTYYDLDVVSISSDGTKISVFNEDIGFKTFLVSKITDVTFYPYPVEEIE